MSIEGSRKYYRKNRQKCIDGFRELYYRKRGIAVVPPRLGKREFCKKGRHLWISENLLTKKNGNKTCRLCHNLRRLKSKYGVTEERYNELLLLQNNCCAICHSKVPRGRYTERFLVDHDHKTGEVRGLLCFNCNSFLGLAEDSISILQKGIQYLARS